MIAGARRRQRRRVWRWLHDGVGRREEGWDRGKGWEGALERVNVDVGEGEDSTSKKDETRGGYDLERKKERGNERDGLKKVEEREYAWEEAVEVKRKVCFVWGEKVIVLFGTRRK